MIGTIAGDIIGSPYVNNPRQDTTDYFFPLFDSSEMVTIQGLVARSRTYKARPSVITDLAKAVTDWYLSGDHSAEAWAEKREDYLGDRHPSGTEVLAVCGPLAKLSGDVNEAIRLSSVAIAEMKPRGELVGAAADYMSLLWSVRQAGQNGSLVAARKHLQDEGYDMARNSSEIRPFLDGTVVKGEAGKLNMGDGKIVTTPDQVIPAVFAAVSESQSFEEAVRRGVALGGNPSLNAALVGAVAELRWDVPASIRDRAVDFLSADDRALVNRYDRFLKAKAEGQAYFEDRSEVNGTQFSVIRMEGMGSIYVVPEGRKDIEAALKKINEKAGKSLKNGDYAIIRPEDLDSTLQRLNVQKTTDGVSLDGTYLEHPRPELKHLWFQNGAVKTSMSRNGIASDGDKLLSEAKRLEIRNDFAKLKDYANDVRTKLERAAGFSATEIFADAAGGKLNLYTQRLLDGEGWTEDTAESVKNAVGFLKGDVSKLSIDEVSSQLVSFFKGNSWFGGFEKEIKNLAEESKSLEGRHIHFASAFYPVVLDQSIEIRQGDILRARVGINDDGRFKVDTNAMTGGVHTEGIEGVLATMNLISKNASMSDFMAALDTYCLDYGHIEDEQEREDLKIDDANADAIKKKYKSNIDRAIDDLGMDIKVAVMPDGPVLSGRAEAIREERRAESEERYAGMSRTDVLDSQKHKGSVFTVGHSNMSQEEFDALMKRHGIEVLVDIRSYPKSKFSPHFNGDALDKHVAENDIEYYHFPEFGGKQYTGTGDDKRLMSYEEIMKTPEFKKGMQSLRDCVKQGYRVALMSSENDPMDSHRMVMMGRALAHPEIYGSKAKPIDVQHITRQGYTLEQGYFERKMVDTYGPYMDKNLSDKEALKEAYRLRGENLVNKSSKAQGISLKRNASKQAEMKKSTYRRRR